MIYYDIHTHKQAIHPEDITILSVDIRKPSEIVSTNNQGYAVGVHPWYIDAKDPESAHLLFTKASQLALLPSVVAIGETGLDKKFAKSAKEFMIQQEIFIEHVHLSGEVKKPLIIHCVKAWNDLLRIHRSVQPTIPWIIHGFRGKETLATQLLNAGFYLSFGPRYHAEALKAAWLKRRLFLETDDNDIDIRNVYQQVANKLSIPLQALSEQIEKIIFNFQFSIFN